MGYGWIFGQPGQVSVGIGDTMAEFARPKEAFAAFLGQHGVSLPGKLVGHKIPLGGFRRPVAKGRVFLVGDAGGFTDAVLGEGIGYAVRSGQVAARCIAQSLRNGGHSGTADRYAAAIDLEMGGELRQSLLLAKAMQLMPRWLLRSMLTDPGALSRYVDILAGRMRYAAFNWWIVRRLPYYLARSARSWFMRSGASAQLAGKRTT